MRAGRRGSAGELFRPVSRLVESVVIAGERDLAITLRHHRADAPLALADADLAVAKAVAGPRGRLARDPAGLRSRVDCGDRGKPRGASVMTITRDGAPALRLLIAPGDPRDLLDQDVDLLLTRDPRRSATQPRCRSFNPFRWRGSERTCSDAGTLALSPSLSLSDDARQALAIDAIRGEARGARGRVLVGDRRRRVGRRILARYFRRAFAPPSGALFSRRLRAANQSSLAPRNRVRRGRRCGARSGGTVRGPRAGVGPGGGRRSST